jgi:hypothetical protein
MSSTPSYAERGSEDVGLRPLRLFRGLPAEQQDQSGHHCGSFDDPLVRRRQLVHASNDQGT